MKTVFSQPQQIEKLAPVAAHLGAATGPFEGVRAGRGLHFGEHGQQAVGNRNGVGSAGSALGHGKGDRAGLQVHAVQRDARLLKAAARVKRDFKADAHPVRHMRHGQGPAHESDVVIGKDGFTGDRRLAGPEVHHGHGGQVAQQPALAVDPFEDFDVLQGLVAAREGSVGAGRGGAPGDVVRGRGRGEVMQKDPALLHKTGQVSPGVSVVDFGGVGHLVLGKKRVDPARVMAGDCFFLNGKSVGLRFGLGSMERVVRSKSRGFGSPRSVRLFISDPIPLAVFSFVNRGHVASVSNSTKTERN